MAKKSDKPDKNAQLEQRVDEMMNLNQPVNDVAKIAENFNKEFLADKPVVKPKQVKSAPELPDKLKVDEEIETPPEAAKPTRTAPTDNQNFDADKLADKATDEAVDDIVAKEGDTALAVEDAKRAKLSRDIKPKAGWRQKLKAILKDKRTWIAVGVLLLVLLAVPATRYKILGLVIKKPVTIKIMDSKTNTPVSGAEVEIAGASAKTDGEGQATLRTAVGSHKINVNKTYYSPLEQPYFVGFKSKQSSLKLTATGRLVPVTVLNKVTGKPVKAAQVKILGSTAKTNSRGLATIALPTKNSTNPGKISLSGYNSADVTVQVTDKAVKTNNFELTPAGHIYFLSNRSGKLDVVKSNLDGSGRKTVLEGTGREEARSTSLLASRDWRYLVLKARREAGQEALYLIDTSNDNVTPFDTSGAEYKLIGWYDHSFIYSLTKSDTPYWQSGRQQLKSYDATNQQLNQLDQTQGEGDAASYAYQSFNNFYIVKGAVVYSTQWYVNGAASESNDKNNTIRNVQPGGQGKKDLQTFTASNGSYIEARLYAPAEVYFAAQDGAKITYYEYENQTVKTVSVDRNDFEKDYPTYLLSPTGGQTFWSELRDGKNALFTGNANAENKKQTASLSPYASYGWYGDDYILLSKNSSELYISTPSGMAGKRPPLKITDYYKPALNYPGYGYGYGGL